MTFADTGFLIAIADSADALHARARAWAAVAPPPFVVTEHVLWEVANYFATTELRTRFPEVAEWIVNSELYEFLPASPALLKAGLAIYGARPDKSWSLTDCISFHVMSERGMLEALAHDHHFEQAGFVALLQREP